MLTSKELEILIDRPESSILDFKSKMFDFEADNDKNTAALIKDIICFSNTIRNETSYIIIGIEEKNDGTKDMCGLYKHFDGAIFHDKVKDKVFPRPKFEYYELELNGKTFGVFEFPITKYQTPITPSTKLKGLDVGRVYYRNGTSNTEALAHEVIRINDWFKSLPDNNDDNSLSSEVTQLLAKLTKGEIKLSVVFTEALELGRKYKLNRLVTFCKSELLGFDEKEINKSQNPEEINYRIQKVLISPDKIEINHYYSGTEYMIKEEMKKNDAFFDFQIFFVQAVSVIESEIEKIISHPNTLFATTQISALKVFPNSKGKDYPLSIYIFKDNFSDLYQRIRQKAIDILVSI